MKKLSIITICYNAPDLDKTCESIVNQTWQDFEWIVIDGGSNKKTLDIFEKYKFKIDKFISESDKGIYNACNKGINLARGKYIQFLNAGDSFYNENVLEQVFSKDFNSGVIYGEQNEVYLNNPKKNKITNLPDKIDSTFLISSNIHTPACFILRELFVKFGGFNEEFKIVSDYEKWVIFLKNNIEFLHVNQVIANFDKSGISSKKPTKILHDLERQKVINKYFTSDEINIAKNRYQKLSLLQKIFSIKNSFDRNHKEICILGVKFKIRRSLKYELSN